MSVAKPLTRTGRFARNGKVPPKGLAAHESMHKKVKGPSRVHGIAHRWFTSDQSQRKRRLAVDLRTVLAAAVEGETCSRQTRDTQKNDRAHFRNVDDVLDEIRTEVVNDIADIEVRVNRESQRTVDITVERDAAEDTEVGDRQIEVETDHFRTARREARRDRQGDATREERPKIVRTVVQSIVNVAEADLAEDQGQRG